MEIITLLIQCPDKPGIVATLSNWVFQHGGNITSSHQYTTDAEGGQFFMRIAFCNDTNTVDALQQAFAEIAAEIDARFELFSESKRPRMGVFVSKHDHVLYELLYHSRTGELACDISCIISNHPDCEELAKRNNIPYHLLEMNKENKAEQEEKILALVKDTDFLVLARYMQILSGDFLRAYQKDIINIHHSFLPSFIGANPYQQAFDRGVKLIGATAHYVTEDLDEGPIIEQMVERVTHVDDAKSLKQKGKHIEKLTLMKAVTAHAKHRVIRFGNKTIVF